MTLPPKREILQIKNNNQAPRIRENPHQPAFLIWCVDLMIVQIQQPCSSDDCVDLLSCTPNILFPFEVFIHGRWITHLFEKHSKPDWPFALKTPPTWNMGFCRNPGPWIISSTLSIKEPSHIRLPIFVDHYFDVRRAPSVGETKRQICSARRPKSSHMLGFHRD